MKILILLFLILTVQAQGACHKSKVDFYFANGMFNSHASARESLKELRLRMTSKYQKNLYDHYEVAYNTNEFVLLQLLQVYRHKMEDSTISFWKWLGDFSNFKDSDVFKKQFENIFSAQSIKDGDLKKQIARYQKSIDEKYSVITIAHSQGNFYTNFVFEKLNSDKNGELFAYRQVQHAYESAFQKAGLPFRATHIMRHGGASYVHNKTNGDLSMVQTMTGNRDYKSALVYAHRNPLAL